MESERAAGMDGAENGMILLGIDTCGPVGSVALGRLTGDAVEVLGETELEGRSYSTTLVAAVGELLAANGLKVRDLGAMVAVNGPGSFTGVRVGLSAVKGLAEAGRTPVAVVSRLEVLAEKAGVESAALDAHRGEVFLLLVGADRELLAGESELAFELEPARVAVCDEPAAALLGKVWAGVEQVRVPAPSAADALRCAAARVAAGEFVDLAMLDGHYLRRSDAEIFGDTIAVAHKGV